MLSSHLISVSQTTKSPLLLRTCASASVNMLRPAKPASTCPWTTHQTREFRIGCWSSYLDPSFEKEVKRRHRLMRYKYLDALNRRLSWDHEPSKFLKHFGKSFMCSAWRSQDARPGGRWVDMDRLNSFKHDSDPILNHNEYVERAKRYQRALHDFMRSKTVFPQGYSKNQLYAKIMGIAEVSAARTSKAEDKLERKSSCKYSSSSRTNQDYEIDPITNRKVFRNDSGGTAKDGPIDIPVKTFKGYQPRFQSFIPPEITPTQAELDTYNKPFMYNEPDGKLPDNPDPVQQGLRDYDSSNDGYKPFRFQEPDGKLPPQPDPVQECLKDYDGEGYQPFYHNEPDGKLPEQPDPVQEGLKDYDESTSYTAFRYREPDGKLPEKPDAVQESLKDYDGITSYGSFRYNEPDGKLPEKPDAVQESLKDYDGITSYGSFRYNEPDGKLPEKPDVVQESLKDYDGITSYGSFRYNEPDGKPPAEKDSVRESLKDYDSTTSYAAFRFNEPDGKFAEYADTSREALKDYDLKQENMTQTSQSVEPRLHEGYQQRRSYPSRTLYSGDKDTREDLDLLRASDIRAASGICKSANKESAEDKSAIRQQLEKSFQESQENAVAYANETVAAQQANDEEPKAMPAAFANDAQKIRDGVYDRVNAKNKGETKSDDGAKGRKLTGNFVRDFPEEFETSWTTKKEGSGILTPKTSKSVWGHDKSQDLGLSSEQEFKDNSSSRVNSAGKTNLPRLQTSLDRITNVKSKATKAQVEADPYSKAPQGLEISYKNECAEQGIGGSSVYCSSYGNVKTTSGKDKELIKEVRSIYEDTYGTIDCKHRQVAENDAKLEKTPTETASENPEPTLYKILAYDPTMQTINIAETTSIVTDNASALTPAEVLLRLSHPAKFFPHFKPLQSQGYEIISGSGDVLVFRKVRSGAPPALVDDIKKKTINPIDGMQVATGNFASPTGFVNHDLPVSTEPPFKSNIDVRREESVFSGKSSWNETTTPKAKKGGKLKRVLLGGAIVGGGSYAVGVVSEFFRTGGMDGKGPQGF
ncbi:hypothetical protein ACMFMG_003550 [Clarireedia jacksonii]